jgi:predicted nucleotidyltransferase
MEPEPSLRELITLANVLEGTLGIPVDIIPLRKAPP